MKIIALLLASTLSIACAGQSQAVVRIANDRGGLIQRYLDRYDELKGTGQTVVIDGLCASACTILLAKIPSDRVCVTERANLAFHAAWDLGAGGRHVTNREATRMIYSMYPAPVRSWISGRGGLSPHTIFLRGAQLQTIFARCYLDSAVFLRS
ncbi:hypothetical protein [Bradyrhizobium sp. WSM471]|uniref:hypothetical protein n=1 Tax=Bradyrhizobium sp. WSM471 TaxID=319017 RepID=UPI00024D2CBC|nr:MULTISPECIES: hypothetical protein [Bradyrhizobium]EHR04930.1 hypothetical protein Bra471DRAFT_05736 [Bradyrhizobium sp. WSM471]UFW40063.1 hypothetical protein BcanWSM471_28160 [Bradyrhizobium canariense]